jgi:hypothetical protein
MRETFAGPPAATTIGAVVKCMKYIFYVRGGTTLGGGWRDFRE